MAVERRVLVADIRADGPKEWARLKIFHSNSDKLATGMRHFVCGKLTVGLRIINRPEGRINAIAICQVWKVRIRKISLKMWQQYYIFIHLS